jgi:hypothetical protein
LSACAPPRFGKRLRTNLGDLPVDNARKFINNRPLRVFANQASQTRTEFFAIA